MDGPRICVVDDDPSFRKLCQAILGPEGFTCIFVEDFSDTVDEVAAAAPDLVLVDLRLGAGFDGVEILAELSANEQTNRIPVIICTAAHDLVNRHREWLDDLGCEIVEKPFDIDDLIAAIERCLSPTALTE
ncbi:MAG: response regulator [Dehalococcoidia bacterium]|nr:response regulator [Dehalococcoidia bacterium]